MNFRLSRLSLAILCTRYIFGTLKMNEFEINTIPKSRQSQLLQAEIESFLAKGGKIKQLDSCNQVVLKNYVHRPNGDFKNDIYNKEVRVFLLENPKNFQLLSERTGIERPVIQDYANGYLMMSKHRFERDFFSAIFDIRAGK